MTRTLEKALIGAAALGLVAASCAGPALAATTIKFAHVYEAGHPLHQAALMAAEHINERTDGRYDVKVFPASSLGKEKALTEALSLGTVDIIYTGAGFAGSIYGPISITDFPFTLRSLDHWRAYGRSDLFRELTDGFSKATGGNVIAAISYYGTRHVTSKNPILKPADMDGLKIRVPNAPAYVLFPEAVGANPTPMAFSEVYLALQQGVVDAQENPLPTIQAKKFYEVQPHINLTGHITNSTFTIVSPWTLGKMSDADRATVVEVLQNSADWVTAEIIKSEESLVDWFRGKGINVNEVDRKPFIAAVAPALQGDDLPFSADVYQRLQAIAGSE